MGEHLSSIQNKRDMFLYIYRYERLLFIKEQKLWKTERNLLSSKPVDSLFVHAWWCKCAEDIP